MNKTGSEAQIAHRKVQSSTTLNRKYVKAPATRLSAEKIAKDYRAERQLRRQAIADQMNKEAAERAAKKRQNNTVKTTNAETIAPKVIAEKKPTVANTASATRKVSTMTAAPVATATPAASVMTTPTPSELKEQAIAKALKNAGTIKEPAKPKFGLGRIILALSCAAISVFAIVYFVNLNMPDFSLRVAAMQTGIEATYPSYIPYSFSLKDIESEKNKITIRFNNTENKSFTLTEEKSSWDSTTLLNNYVKIKYTDYSTIREQGLTIYVADNKATWVSGGIVYEIVSDAGVLSKNQINSIATSL